MSTDPQRGTESDVPVDKKTAHSRHTSGAHEPKGTYVGRVSPDDEGEQGESGAEARAWQHRSSE